MSKLDLLLSFVDNLNLKSNTLISNLNQSNSLIDRISNLQDDISTADLTIDSMNDLLTQNTTFLQEFDSLHEKCFYLEANLHMNDDYTNQTSFEYLNQQYDYLIKLFKEKNHTSDFPHTTSHDYDHRYDDLDVDPINQTPVTPSLSKALSISNLKLKPIRCRSAKVSKKKSHYRLSSAYTLNPLAMDYSPMTGTAYLPSLNQDHDSSTVIINDTLSIKRNRINQKHQYQTSFLTPSRPIHKRYPLLYAPATENSSLNCMDSTTDQSTIATTTYGANSCSHPNKHDTTKNNNAGQVNIGDLDSISSSPLHHVNNSQPRARANSLPETTIARDLYDDFITNENNDDSNDYSLERAQEMKRLRHRRLKHFISYHNGFNRSEMHEYEEDSQIDFNQLDLDYIREVDDMDNGSIYSDISYNDTSPFNEDRLKIEDFDNFESFLRKSRLDLNSAFPHLNKNDGNDSSTLVTKLNSCDSQCSNHKSQFKFHNPVSSVYSNNKSDFVKPTIESIYSQSQPDRIDAKLWDFRKPRYAHKETSAQLLSDVMLKDYELSMPPSPTKTSTPLGKSVIPTLFNLIQSPGLKKSEGPVSKPQPKVESQTRRKSIDVISKSLTETFKSLVNNNPSYINMGPHGTTTGFITTPSSSIVESSKDRSSGLHTQAPPPKLQKLRCKDKRGPISIPNDMQTKRLPPPQPKLSTSTPMIHLMPNQRMYRKDGYHSQLTIGPRKIKIIDHGDSSVFKKPLVSKVSHDSLRQALSESLT